MLLPTQRPDHEERRPGQVLLFTVVVVLDVRHGDPGGLTLPALLQQLAVVRLHKAVRFAVQQEDGQLGTEIALLRVFYEHMMSYDVIPKQ